MRLLILTVSLLLITGCANIASQLSGGKKDENKPGLEKSNLKQTNFKDNYIKLDFDEYITLENAQNTITIQPKHTTFTASNTSKTIRIKFDSSLRENTTYILDIASGIKDINEGNTYSLSYAFSTGNEIDTNFITYQIEKFLSYKKLKLGLTLKSVDSIKNLKFDYIYPLNNETMNIRGLKNDPFKCWIFTDNNFDDIPDEYSPVYFDTAQINTTKKVKLVDWIDSRNTKKIKYSHFTKIFKQINDKSSYGLTDQIYIDKDSSLFYNANNDTLPELDIKKELSTKINSRLQAIKTNKEYVVIIDKCGITNISITDKINYTQDENFFYISSRTRIDSINFIVIVSKDSITFYNKIGNYNPSNKMSTLKLSTNNKIDTMIMAVYQNDKIRALRKISIKSDKIFYMEPGAYKIIFYNTNSFKNISFNLENMQGINCSFIENEIILKPNWDEVLQLLFQ